MTKKDVWFLSLSMAENGLTWLNFEKTVILKKVEVWPIKAYDHSTCKLGSKEGILSISGQVWLRRTKTRMDFSGGNVRGHGGWQPNGPSRGDMGTSTLGEQVSLKFLSSRVTGVDQGLLCFPWFLFWMGDFIVVVLFLHQQYLLGVHRQSQTPCL